MCPDEELLREAVGLLQQVYDGQVVLDEEGRITIDPPREYKLPQEDLDLIAQFDLERYCQQVDRLERTFSLPILSFPAPVEVKLNRKERRAAEWEARHVLKSRPPVR